MAFLLARANAFSLARANAVLQPHGLKVRSYSVLALAVSGVRPTQRDLSEFLRLDPSQIVALIDGLESCGLVSREPDPNDRRANVVIATDAGREAWAAARESVSLAEVGFFGAFSDQDRERLTAMLRALAMAPDDASD